MNSEPDNPRTVRIVEDQMEAFLQGYQDDWFVRFFRRVFWLVLTTSVLLMFYIGIYWWRFQKWPAYPFGDFPFKQLGLL